MTSLAPMASRPEGLTIDEVVDSLHERLRDHAVYAAQAQRLEHARKALISKLILEQEGVPVTKAEHIARASQPYAEHLALLAKAQTDASTAFADVEWYRARLEVWRTKSASARAQQQGRR